MKLYFGWAVLQFVFHDRMKLCRFKNSRDQIRIGVVYDQSLICDLTAVGIESIQPLLEFDPAELLPRLGSLANDHLPKVQFSDVRLLTPVERQEIWAAGVTYLRSKKARMDESDFSANAYDRVYEAERPELFFKSLPEKVVPPNDRVGMRHDSSWNVPEPELALVLNSHGDIAGYTIGNDMSSRAIEGENTLYLPQAKVYDRSCAVGPFIAVGPTEAEARSWQITLTIRRAGEVAFQGATSVGQIKRSFEELARFLFRSQTFPNGAILLTGTGVVPPDDFTLQPEDRVEIEISGIGTLSNTVVQV